MPASLNFNLRARSFDWAEPLICEQVLHTYQPTREAKPLGRLVTVQTKMWLSLIDGDEQGFESRQHELARLATEANLSTDEIDRANRAVLLELILVVVTRFRNSDRIRLNYVERLQTALRVIKAKTSYTLH